jgi:hypothetical protein
MVFTPLHIQNARFAGSYEWHGTVTLRILNAQRCKNFKPVDNFEIKPICKFILDFGSLSFSLTV